MPGSFLRLRRGGQKPERFERLFGQRLRPFDFTFAVERRADHHDHVSEQSRSVKEALAFAFTPGNPRKRGNDVLLIYRARPQIGDFKDSAFSSLTLTLPFISAACIEARQSR